VSSTSTRTRRAVVLGLAAALVACGLVVLVARPGDSRKPIAAAPAKPPVAAARAGDSLRPARRSGRRPASPPHPRPAARAAARPRSARATARLFLHRLARRDPALCGTLTRAGAARLRAILSTAAYPVPRKASCAYAAGRLSLAIGRTWARRLVRAASRAPLRHHAGVVSATFRVPGVKPLQHMRLRRIRGRWMIERMPGAWAEGRRPASD
jgi:hypothetical protein